MASCYDGVRGRHRPSLDATGEWKYNNLGNVWQLDREMIGIVKTSLARPEMCRDRMLTQIRYIFGWTEGKEWYLDDRKNIASLFRHRSHLDENSKLVAKPASSPKSCLILELYFVEVSSWHLRPGSHIAMVKTENTNLAVKT